jgi:hypothetical protein
MTGATNTPPDLAVHGYFAAAIGRAFFPERAAGLWWPE